MQIREFQPDIASARILAFDTTFVLFFLAIDFGQTLASYSTDALFSGVTLVMLLVLPYFMLSERERPVFGDWLAGRALIALFAGILGVIIKQLLGVLLPELFRFLPLTLLIAAATISFIVQFCGIMKIRLAR